MPASNFREACNAQMCRMTAIVVPLLKLPLPFSTIQHHNSTSHQDFASDGYNILVTASVVQCFAHGAAGVADLGARYLIEHPTGNMRIENQLIVRSDSENEGVPFVPHCGWLALALSKQMLSWQMALTQPHLDAM